MKKFLVALLLVSGFAYADVTNNLITNPTFNTTSGWTTSGMVGGRQWHPAQPANGTGYSFSYSEGSIAQAYAINQALANVGVGVQVQGFDYGFTYQRYCANSIGGSCENPNGAVDTLSYTAKITNSSGVNIYTNTQNLSGGYMSAPASIDVQQRFSNPYAPSELGNFSISFTGRDGGFWGGNYGPTINNVYSKAVYTVDPCITNPAYSPTCANYNTVTISPNLVPNPNGYSVYGAAISQTYAINQALGQAGAGATIHGFEWGYVANANGPYCNGWDIFGCWGQTITPSVSTSVNITDSNNNSLYSVNRTYTNSYNTTNYRYVFPTSRNISTLGNFEFTGTTNDAAYLGSMWSKSLYTANPCVVDPLSSTTCPGYQAAYFTQQCNSNPLYSSQCPGYTVAYFNQQCSINQLYNPTCPGYAAAYLDYQCSVNPLYSTTCTGYEQAYFNQQCSANPLYSTRCTGYAEAYQSQQCGINPLYSTTCTGYASAYHDQQCSANPLYATNCPGYSAAYLTQQCTANPLYSTQCSGYAAAYKAQQCSANALYATDCPGYAQAYFNQQCSLNGLYDTRCSNYAEAYAKKMLLEKQGMASTVATAGVVAKTAEVANAATTATTSDGSSSVAVAVVADPVVNATVTTTATSTSPAAAATATVSLAPAPAPAPAAKTEAAAEPKKAEGGQQQAPQQAQGQGGDKPQPSARQQLAERRAEAAKKDAVEKGKNLANEMGKAADMESQKQVQNVVIQAMGFTPGFDTYGKVMVPDAVGYRPFTVYNNQKNVDNRRLGMGLYGPSDRLHNDLVDSQYKE
jgi:hypothetical protein